MKLNSRTMLWLSALCLSCSFTTVFIYATWINPVKKIYIEESIKARQAAEHEWLFTDKINNIFHSAEPTDFTSAASQGVQSVVYIRSYEALGSDRIFSKTFSTNTGSGVIVSSDGYIVTNNHVVGDGDEIEVVLNDNRELKARLIGGDPYTDLALLKIDAQMLPYVMLGNSDSLKVGEWVIAVGNPFKLQSTVTAGIVSAKGRNINILENSGIESFIQTDAAVNPGNSGGALLNSSGLLVGINTAIISSSGGYEGFSFAIPVNLAKKVITDLKEYGVVQRGWMGVELQNVDNAIADNLKLDEVKGVFITSVVKDGAAHDAGIQNGDIILKLNGKETNTVPSFMEHLAQFRPGDKVSMEYLRNKTRKLSVVTLKNQLNTTDFVAIRRDPVLRKLGIEIRNLDSYEKTRFKMKGVIVISVENGSLLGLSNVEPGYIITKVNDKTVEDAQQLVSYLESHPGKIVLEGFYENYPGTYPYTFELK